MNYRIAPSILSADFARLGAEVSDVIAAGADWIHFDVMDNHYVPNLTFGPMVCAALKSYACTAQGAAVPIDVHLMVQPVDALAAAFAQAGADFISFHPDASGHVHRSIQAIAGAGCKAGLVFNPAEPLEVLDWVIDDIDLVLIMSVNPGFGGQSFIASALRKIEAARRRIDASGKDIRLEVDGGIKSGNIRRAADAGADTFVAGSAIFGQPDYRAVIDTMRSALAWSQSHVPDANRTGMEALVRWIHPQRGLGAPVEFIPTTEAVGLIGKLGLRWIDDPAPLIHCRPMFIHRISITGCSDRGAWPWRSTTDLPAWLLQRAI